MKKKSLFYFVVVFALLICIPLVIGVKNQNEGAAIAEEDMTVVVGYMDYDGFIDPQSDGTYSGYAAEYLFEIAKYTNFKYDYKYYNWTTLLEKLESGEIDIVCSAQYTEERAAKFDFTDYPIGYTEGLIYAKKGSEIGYEDYDALNGKRVGFIKGNAMIDIYKSFEEVNNFSSIIVEYSTEADLVVALNAGDVEAICSEHLANHTGLTLLGKFGADAFYIMSKQGNPVIGKINTALQYIKTDVDFEPNLFHKYYDSSTAQTTLQFTSAEKNYIENAPAIKVCLNTNRVPFSSYDEKTQTFSGICVDILESISETSGLTFEYIAQPVGETTPKILQEDNICDMICGIERDNFTTNTAIASTNAFLESAVVPVGKVGRELTMSDSLKVAIPKSYSALKKVLENDYENLTIVLYDSNIDCLNALMDDEVDLFVQNTHVLSALLQSPRYETLNILPVQIMTENTAIAMLRDENPVLLSIINKAILNIDEATISSSLISHTFASQYTYTVSDFMFKYKNQIIVIFLLVLCAFALLLTLLIYRRVVENKLKEKNVMLADVASQADRANVAKSMFLSRMSHEIRTPMNAIMGMTEIAKSNLDSKEKIADCLTKIDVSSKVLLNIINDVLDMSAIESNKIKIAHEEFDIKQIISNISTVYYSQCQHKGVDFEMSIDLEDEYLIGDSLRVNQILMNLVSNAYKFTPTGKKIEILVQETTRKNDIVFIRFIVKDTGCGMSADMKERLFKPFEQESETTAKNFGGSGLGLSIVKNMVDLMHGAISVESEKDKGTTFYVDLPFKLTNNKVEQRNLNVDELRILAVDDDKAAREYTSIVLKRIGLNFDIASSGAEALSMIRKAQEAKNPYNVCLIDWQMPDMDGIELTKRIRASEDKKTLIIIVSAYDMNMVVDEAKAVGADHFVAKPLFQSTLVNVLMNLTHGKITKKPKKADEYDFTGHKVLIAEDNEINQEVVKELLNLVKLDYDIADNGEMAVEMFEKAEPNTYDLIFMDVQMPVMNGYEATKAIRALKRPDAKTIQIYAMTANAFAADVTDALSSGMNGHLAKPINSKLLYETIENIIDSNIK